ncbi:helix-turn-helix domain-containing protein [Dielma fastidiosa]|uniref:helix-turn-helix domain-containing protein n=1 Tax=Dielma fastidiosa TaxID=1034346 RepID=UPI0034B97D53
METILTELISLPIFMNEFGKQLYIVRKHKNLTLRQLDELSGVKFVRIGRFENDKEQPTLEIIRKLENALGVSFEQLENVSREIKELYARFVDTLIYDRNDLNQYIELINKNRGIYLVNSHYPIILLILYIIDIHKNNLAEAEKIEEELEKLLLANSEYCQLYYEYKGVRFYLQEHYEEAANILTYAMTIANNYKQNTMICYHLSMVNMSRNIYIEALSYADMAKKGFVEFASFKRILYIEGQIGSIYSQMRRFDLAINKYTTCLTVCETLDVSPTTKALFYRNLSWIYIKSGNYSQSLAYLEKAEILDPENIYLRMYKIWCNYKLGRYNTARSLTIQYKAIEENKSFKKRFKLFCELVYKEGTMPTLPLLKSAIDVYDEFAAKCNFELMNFYIDIVVDLLKQRDDDKRLIQYLETKIKINNEINQQRNY